MNLTKAAHSPTTVVIHISETESFKVWAKPNLVTQEFLDKRKGGDYPISRILAELISDWELTYDIETDEDEVTEGEKKKSKKVKSEKLPITKEAIDKYMPLWMQNEIWQSVFQYKLPNLMKSNP